MSLDHDVTIEQGSAADVAALRELWLELHHHHATVAPGTGTFTDDATSWAMRSRQYREWLSDGRSFLLLARAGDRLAGYAVVVVMDSGPDLRDSWRVPDVIAELETMVVAAPLRGAGIGGRLLDAIDERLDRLGITTMLVGVMPGNDGARRLYERRGFRPQWLTLHRSAPPPASAGAPTERA